MTETLRSTEPVAAVGTPIVQVRDLTKRFPVRRSWERLLRRPFDRRWATALDRVSLDVQPGEFFGLLGPNGAGKTTLFKMLATLTLPDAGSASVTGLDVVAQAGDVRRVLTPVIADERSLFWRLSALENLRLFAALYGHRGAEAERRAREVRELVGLGDAGEKLVGAYSSGMRQRLLVGRALLSDPKVLLLDEPTRSLDPISARDFRRFLRERVSGAQRCSVLLATHNADEALRLCDRVGVLHRGRLLAMGTVDELLARVGDARHRMVAAPGARSALEALEASGHVTALTSSPTEDEDWVRFEMQIPGDRAEAAGVLSVVTRSGAAVARFERRDLTLADLLERILSGAGDA